MWPTVIAPDIEDRWRPLTAEEKAIVGQRLSDAQAELNRELRLAGLPGTPQYLSADELTDWNTVYVATVVAAVRRVLVNPDGWLEERDELDDWGRTRRRDSAVSTGNLYFTDDEIAKLLPRVRRKRGAFTIALGQS